MQKGRLSIFSRIYDYCITLAAHPKAPWFLGLDSFAESCFWPVPPDVMLAPMCLARPQRAYLYAALTTLTSIAGAVCGYYLGYFVYDPYVKDLIEFLGQEAAVETVRHWFTLKYGMLMIFLGAFTPIPYKVIAITSGLLAAESVAGTGSAGFLGIGYFLLMSVVGRGIRFFLEAGIIAWGGEKMERAIRRYIDVIGWICVALAGGYIVYAVFK